MSQRLLNLSVTALILGDVAGWEARVHVLDALKRARRMWECSLVVDINIGVLKYKRYFRNMPVILLNDIP